MEGLTAGTVAGYLVRQGWFPGIPVLAVEALSGGVSSQVFRVRLGDGREVVVKQPLGRLRVAEEWLCDPDRARNEAEALKRAEGLLSAGMSPRLLGFGGEDLCLLMEAAPRGIPTWK